MVPRLSATVVEAMPGGGDTIKLKLDGLCGW